MKQALRQAMLARRLAQDPAVAAERSRQAQAHLLAWAGWQGARTVLLYAPFRGEVATDLLASAAPRPVYPRVAGRDLSLHLLSGPLLPGAFGIPEPDPAWPVVAPQEIDLAVAPGVAFGRDGSRLGYGKGYYDRLLGRLPGVKVGLCFAFQVVDALPVEPHDLTVDYLASEEGVAACRSSTSGT